MEVITLNTPSMQGEIAIGTGVLQSRLPKLLKGQKNFALIDENVISWHYDLLSQYFKSEEIFILPSGEQSKSFQKLGKILGAMEKQGLHRNSKLFAVGGGVVGDIGGLAAALYMRGISCVQIPTTLLAQVDSSVGGKTAVNMGGVKNIVGAFYQPNEVLVDPIFLETLPEREIKCGLGEVVKYAALSEEIFAALDGKTADELADKTFLSSLVSPCIAHKARVVEIDEKETGERKSLNVGHTTGHAIEPTSGLSHGECVLIGMLIETKIAIEQGVCEKAYGERLLKIIQTALSVSPQSGYNVSRAAALAYKAATDKKNKDDGKIVMALPQSLGKWCSYAMDFAEYKTAVSRAVKGE